MDNHATTPLDPRVLEGMVAFLKDSFGNPASQTHRYGWQAEAAVEKARQQVAHFLGARDVKNIIFTSGATEANNLAILGTVKNLTKPAHIIVSATEHKAVLEVAQVAAEQGHELTVLEVDNYGCVNPKALEHAFRPNTKLVSIMWANNEIGSINPIEELAALCSARGIYFHTDGVQAAGKIAIDVANAKIDMLSISAHKMYGPKGVGALYVNRAKVPLAPLMHGGSQEFGLRPGTLNVPGIVGLGLACQFAALEMSVEVARLTRWRDQIINAILDDNDEALLNGHPKQRLCNNISISMPTLTADLFSLGLNNVACSSGSACTSGAAEISHVLKAIGRNEQTGRHTLRLGLGRFTTEQEVTSTITTLLGLCKNRKECNGLS